jgi:hypothetical protein
MASFLYIISSHKGGVMAIVSLPSNTKIPTPLICVICGVVLQLEQATAGLCYANGQQALACTSHFAEMEKLITGWADFSAIERQKYFERVEDQGSIGRRPNV